MKIQVRRDDDKIEVLTLTEPITITRCSCGHNYLTTSTGMEHHFTSEGIYDGFGFVLTTEGATEEEARAAHAMKEAAAYLEQYDRDREVIDLFPEGA